MSPPASEPASAPDATCDTGSELDEEEEPEEPAQAPAPSIQDTVMIFLTDMRQQMAQDRANFEATLQIQREALDASREALDRVSGVVTELSSILRPLAEAADSNRERWGEVQHYLKKINHNVFTSGTKIEKQLLKSRSVQLTVAAVSPPKETKRKVVKKKVPSYTPSAVTYAPYSPTPVSQHTASPYRGVGSGETRSWEERSEDRKRKADQMDEEEEESRKK